MPRCHCFSWRAYRPNDGWYRPAAELRRVIGVETGASRAATGNPWLSSTETQLTIQTVRGTSWGPRSAGVNLGYVEYLPF